MSKELQGLCSRARARTCVMVMRNIKTQEMSHKNAKIPKCLKSLLTKYLSNKQTLILIPNNEYFDSSNIKYIPFTYHPNALICKNMLSKQIIKLSKTN